MTPPQNCQGAHVARAPPALLLREEEGRGVHRTVAFLDKITDLNLELGQALRLALRLRANA